MKKQLNISIYLWLLMIVSKSLSQNCFPGYPLMSVGDVNLTKENFEQEIRNRRNVLVHVTGSNCEPCCKYEPQIQAYMNNTLKNPSHILYQEKIEVGRILGNENVWFLQKYNINYLPNLIFFKNGKPYPIYQHQLDGMASLQIGKFVNPFYIIESFDHFEKMLNFREYDDHGRTLQRTKVLAMFDSPDSYEEIIEEFLSASEDLLWRLDVQMALVTDVKILKEIYKNYGKKFFEEEFDKNSLVVFSHKNRFEKEDTLVRADIENSNIRSFSAWIKSNINPPVPEFTKFNRISYAGEMPLVVAFINTQDEYNSEVFLEQLRDLAKTQLGNLLNIVWMDYQDSKNEMKSMGVYGRK